MSLALRGAPLSLALAATALAGCAAITPAIDAPPAKPAAATASSKPAAPVPGQPGPFKDVAKDASETAGFFAVHRKDGKAWIAIRPATSDIGASSGNDPPGAVTVS